jgi:diguanylate cyclase (GGDEF)-like protein
MSGAELELLIERARRASFERERPEVMAEVDRLLAGAMAGGDRGALLLARAIARQAGHDPQVSAGDAREAVPLLREAGRIGEAALAASIGAGMTQRAGDLPTSIDLAVEAVVLVGQADGTARDMARAANGLAVLFRQMSAFELAVEFSTRAFRGSATSDAGVREVIAFTMGSCVVEATRVGIAVDLAVAGEATSLLCSEASSDVAREVLGPGIDAELALLGGRSDQVRDRLAAGVDRYDRTAPRLVAWHRLVRATAARMECRHDEALVLLDAALPVLAEVSDDHRLVRAYEERTAVRTAVGDLRGALDDAVTLAQLVRAWQVDQVGQLAGQIRRRAELETKRTLLRRRADDLAREVSEDVVTGVGSRRWLELRLDELAEQPGTGAVVAFDLDRFKSVNDQFGHHIGDLVLARVGRIFLDNVRGDDVVARFGGEEFVVLLPGRDAPAGVSLAERIRQAIVDEPWHEVRAELAVTTSGGVADGPLRSIRDVLRLADSALYEAKGAGRNRVVAA